MKTIQDIDVEHAEEVTTEIVINTVLEFGKRSQKITKELVQGFTVPLCLEI